VKNIAEPELVQIRTQAAAFREALAYDSTFAPPVGTT
jgi:hypothetical protein